MNTITLNAADLVSIATLYNYGDTSRAPITEDLAGVMVKVENGQLTAAATDRYTLATYAARVDDRDIASEFKLPITACKWISTNVKKGNKWSTPAPVAIEITDEEIAIQLENTRATYANTPNRSLKLDRLMPLINEWKPAETASPVMLNNKFLARITKLMDDFGRIEKATYELGQLPNGATNRPGPVRITAGSFRLLIQPNLFTTD